MRNDKMYGKVDYIVANGFTQFNNPAFANDVSPYESFSGDNDAYDNNIEFNDVALDIEFSDASGRKRRKKPRGGKSRINATIEESKNRRDTRRKDRQDLKREELKTQKEIAEQTLKAQDKDTALLSQIGLSNNANLPEVTTQKDNITRNIIIIGSLAVATVVGIFIYKKYNK